MSLRSKKPYSRPVSRADAAATWVHDKAPTGPKSGPSSNLGRARPAPGPAGPNSKLSVSNLHYEITPKDLTAIFGQIGTLVREPLIRYDASGRSTGVAVISFETPAEAVRAKKQFDGILAKGQPMSIAFEAAAPAPKRRAASVPASLLNRIEKAPLLNRLSRDDAHVKPSATTSKGGVGPIRTRGVRAPKKPKTAEELDKELDAFMGDATPTEAPKGEDSSVPVTGAQDVEMS